MQLSNSRKLRRRNGGAERESELQKRVEHWVEEIMKAFATLT
jgi:hypothetical protein